MSIDEETESPWERKEPLLRLFHAIVHDDVLPEYLQVQYALPEEDSFEHQLDIWNRITDLFNDPDFLPRSYFLPSLHRDFNTETELSPLPEKEKMSDLFTRFTICKKQMKSLRNYFFDDTQFQFSKVKPTIVSLLKQSTQNEKLSKLYTFPSTLLYLWHLDDAFQWLTPLEILHEQAANANTKKLPPFDQRRPAHTGFMEVLLANAKDPITKLQAAEKHHANMAKKYADMISKISANKIGVRGKEQDMMNGMVGDVFSRLKASYNRTISIETNIIAKQRDFD